MKDRKRQDMQDKDQPLYQELTETILGCCFEVMNELGVGFLESVYKNALLIALREKGLKVDIEKSDFQICILQLHVKPFP